MARLWNYVLLLVRYDTSYDLRDRARLYRALLGVPQLATLMLLAPKPAPQAPSPSETRRGLALGSSSLVLAGAVGGVHGIRGYEPLPDWVEEGREPDPKLRDQDGGRYDYGDEKRAVPAVEALGEAPPASTGAAGRATKSNGAGEKTLDDWLAEDDDDDDDNDEEEEEEEETEEVSEEESEEEEEEEAEEESEEEDDEEEESSDDDEADELEGFLKS